MTKTPGRAVRWYVIVWEGDRLLGHVGPIDGRTAARRCAQSWRFTERFRARVSWQPMGSNLAHSQHAGVP